jgi:hypothetical protein
MTDLILWFTSPTGLIVVSGALGGTVRGMTVVGTWREKTTDILVGAICASYLGPVIEPVIGPLVKGIVIDKVNRDLLASFLLGLYGVTVPRFILDFMNFRKVETKIDPNKETKP